MSRTLRDQLVRSGLATAKEVDQARRAAKRDAEFECAAAEKRAWIAALNRLPQAVCQAVLRYRRNFPDETILDAAVLNDWADNRVWETVPDRVKWAAWLDLMAVRLREGRKVS